MLVLLLLGFVPGAFLLLAASLSTPLAASFFTPLVDDDDGCAAGVPSADSAFTSASEVADDGVAFRPASEFDVDCDACERGRPPFRDDGSGFRFEGADAAFIDRSADGNLQSDLGESLRLTLRDGFDFAGFVPLALLAGVEDIVAVLAATGRFGGEQD